MKFALPKFLRKKEVAKPVSGSVSGFFLCASEKEKNKVFTEAARRANEEQLKVFNKAQLKIRTN